IALYQTNISSCIPTIENLDNLEKDFRASLAKRRRTSSIKTMGYSQDIFKIIILYLRAVSDEHEMFQMQNMPEHHYLPLSRYAFELRSKVPRNCIPVRNVLYKE
ncbi:hypothetical protein L9F63_023502, partial [Diploptera punctata]